MPNSFSDAELQAAWDAFLARSESASAFFHTLDHGRAPNEDVDTKKRRENLEKILFLAFQRAVLSPEPLAFGRELISLALQGPVSIKPRLALSDNFDLENVMAWTAYQSRESYTTLLHSELSLILRGFSADGRDILSEMRCAFFAELESQAILAAAIQGPRLKPSARSL